MNYVVYILVCPLENIVRYVGLSQNPKNRKVAHLSEKGNLYKFRWIQKLKKKKLKPEFIILRENLSLEKACILEQEFISLYRFLCAKKLTNLTNGGEGRSGFLHKEETKTKIRKAQLGAKNHAYGKTQPVNVRKKKSKSVKQFSIRGRLMNEFYSINEATRQTQIRNEVIIRCCKGKQKTAGGYVWRYELDDFNKFTVKNSQKKSVSQFTLEGVFIKNFNSITEASIESGCDLSDICACCNERLKHSKGFIWRYSK